MRRQAIAAHTRTCRRDWCVGIAHPDMDLPDRVHRGAAKDNSAAAGRQQPSGSAVRRRAGRVASILVSQARGCRWGASCHTEAESGKARLWSAPLLADFVLRYLPVELGHLCPRAVPAAAARRAICGQARLPRLGQLRPARNACVEYCSHDSRHAHCVCYSSTPGTAVLPTLPYAPAASLAQLVCPPSLPDAPLSQVFFIRDGMKFPDMVHSLKPNPKSHIQASRVQWGTCRGPACVAGETGGRRSGPPHELSCQVCRGAEAGAYGPVVGTPTSAPPCPPHRAGGLAHR